MPHQSIFTGIRENKFLILKAFAGAITLNDLNNINYSDALKLNQFFKEKAKDV